MAGVWKVFQLGPVQHARLFFLPFHDTFLPTWSLWFTGFTIPFLELIGGALVILGWRMRAALVALGGVLVIVTFGVMAGTMFQFASTAVTTTPLVIPMPAI